MKPITPKTPFDDFCHHYIINNRKVNLGKNFLACNIPPDPPSIFAKLMGRLSKLHNTYAIIALKDCGLNSFDEFLYLNSICNLKKPKKTEVIYSSFNELSSGLLILDRLRKKGFTIEEDDVEDKRSKRLTMTEKGDIILKECYNKMKIINDLFFNNLPPEDLQLCVQLLSDTEIKFSTKWLEDKGNSFNDLI